MPTSPYLWRTLTPSQRSELLAWRQSRNHPWHSPPHRPNFGHHRFHLTAACYNHHPHIGHSPDRMKTFSHDLLSLLTAHTEKIFAWCVLPNHYHALVKSPDILHLLHHLGQLHGRTSYTWNTEESARGRKVFFRAAERAIRSDRHFWATLNYVHHNPVHHHYTNRWQNWPWSSAPQYLDQTSPAEAARIWRQYPIKNYGQGWDDPTL